MLRRLRYAARRFAEEVYFKVYLKKTGLDFETLRMAAHALLHPAPEGDCRSCGEPTHQEDVAMPDGSVQPAYCLACVYLDRVSQPEWRN